MTTGPLSFVATLILVAAWRLCIIWRTTRRGEPAVLDYRHATERGC